MQKPLPDRVDFLKQVERNARYNGVLPVAGLERLKLSLYDESGQISASVHFSTRAGVPCLDGTVQAELRLECQRCMEPVTQQVTGVFRFGLVRGDEEAALLPKEFEPLLLSEGEQSLIAIIEDELILSLPIVARHDEECSANVRQHNSDRGTETYKPFADLKELMK